MPVNSIEGYDLLLPLSLRRTRGSTGAAYLSEMQPLTCAFSMNSAHRSESALSHIGTGPEAWNTIQKTVGA